MPPWNTSSIRTPASLVLTYVDEAPWLLSVVFVDDKKFTFLYSDGDSAVLME